MSDKRRMFSDTVLRSGELMLSSTMAQLLYVHLCIEADDHGVVNNAVVITRMLGATPEHLEELIANGFVIKLQENLHVIAHWFTQNQIRAERLRESKYKDEIDARLVVDTTGEYHLKDNWSGDVCAKIMTKSRQNHDKIAPKSRQNHDKMSSECHQNVTEMSPQYSIVEYSIDKVSEDKLSNTHDACECETHEDTLDVADPLQVDVPQELAHKAEQVRIKLKDAGLRVCDQISWLMRDFRFALDGKRRLNLGDEEFFTALDNYAVLLTAKKQSPDEFWWDAAMPIPSLFKGTSPPILRFLPSAFDIQDFKTNKPPGKARKPPRRGVDSEYSLKSIAEGT